MWRALYKIVRQRFREYILDIEENIKFLVRNKFYRGFSVSKTGLGCSKLVLPELTKSLNDMFLKGTVHKKIYWLKSCPFPP